MKVNTDGVLLGAWTDVTGATTILDIGTGTGVIALMMAQRTQAEIDAIEIDEHAYRQAGDNFRQSMWSERLKVYHAPLQQFYPQKTYDVIVTNPPYFINDLKTGKRERDVAKHSLTLSYEELIDGISRLLATNGQASVVVPSFHKRLLESLGRKAMLYVTRVMNVVAVSGKPPYLSLLQFGRTEATKAESELTIQDESGSFNTTYRALAKDFYLKF